MSVDDERMTQYKYIYYERDLYSENADSPVKCMHFNKTKTKYVKGYDVKVDSLDGVVDLNMDFVDEGQSFFRSFNIELIPGLKKLLLIF